MTRLGALFSALMLVLSGNTSGKYAEEEVEGYEDFYYEEGAYEEDLPMTADMTFRESADLLESLGVTGISEETVLTLEEYFGEEPWYDKIPLLLSEIGWGYLDYESGEWVQESDQVFWFDLEAYDMGIMYTEALLGLDYIGGEELKITNINEDISQLDFEAGTGTRVVTFEINGTPCQFEAANDGDWYDIAFLDVIDQCLTDSGSEKTLYYMYDEGQGIIIFFRDAQWAERFTQETGCELYRGAYDALYF